TSAIILDTLHGKYVSFRYNGQRDTSARCVCLANLFYVGWSATRVGSLDSPNYRVESLANSRRRDYRIGTTSMGGMKMANNKETLKVVRSEIRLVSSPT